MVGVPGYSPFQKSRLHASHSRFGAFAWSSSCLGGKSSRRTKKSIYEPHIKHTQINTVKINILIGSFYGKPLPHHLRVQKLVLFCYLIYLWLFNQLLCRWFNCITISDWSANLGRCLIRLCRAVPVNDERIVFTSDLVLDCLGQGLERRHLLIVVRHYYFRRLLYFAYSCLILFEAFLCGLSLSSAIIICFHFR